MKTNDNAVLEMISTTLAELATLLVRERSATAAFRLEELQQIAVDKERLAGVLAEVRATLAAAGRDTSGEAGLLAAEVRRRVAEVVAQAAANAALMADAADGIAVALGLEQGTGTYDARARRRGVTRRAASLARTI